MIALLNLKNCKAEFRVNRTVICDLSPDIQFQQKERSIIKTDVLVYGVLNSIGGDTPHLKLVTENQDIFFQVPKETAKELRGFLYETVGIKGEATYDLKTKSILKFKYYNITDYRSGKISEGFSKLREASSGVWDDLVKSNNDINKYLRKD